MNILFITISSLPHVSEHGISLDLLNEFRRNGHSVYIICAIEKKVHRDTYIAKENGCTILRVKIGNNKGAGIIEKGLTTVFFSRNYISAINNYYSDIKFDLILYPTPPVTHADIVKYIKERDGAKSYLLLKDIFPQNAVDIGMMSKNGIKGLIYKYFRAKEKKLYAISDRIGCMSEANVRYLLEHNPEIDPKKVEVCPNCIEVIDKSIDEATRMQIREKYGIPLDKKVFVYGGNLGKPQGIPFFIECMKKCGDIKEAFFLVVGNGTEYNLLEEYVTSSRQDNLKLMKTLPKDDYDTLVAACDVGMIFLDYQFTIPNFPSRLLGYLQAKLPVLACTDQNTDIGKTIEDGSFGWWSKSDSVRNFDESIQASLAADLKKLGENGFIQLNKFWSVKKQYKDIVKFIEYLA